MQSSRTLMTSGLTPGKTNQYSMLHAKLGGLLSRGNMPRDNTVLSR